jgi:hypothetical protein
MARLARTTQIIFGASGLVGTGGYGAAAIGNVATEVATSSALSTIMGTAAWGAGWLNAVLGSTKFPAVEDLNAVEYVNSTQLAYLFQQGIPEYDAGTTYYVNSLTMKSGTWQLYGSLTDANIGNALSDGTNWKYLGDLSVLAANGQFYTGGTSTGSANAQVVTPLTPGGFSLSDNGATVSFTAGYTNTGATTVNAAGTGAIAVQKLSGGVYVPLTGSEITATNTYLLTVNTAGNFYQLSTAPTLGTLAALNYDGVDFTNSGGNLAFGSAPVLPNGTTAHTQTVGTNNTDVATCAFVINNQGTATKSSFKNLQASWASNAIANLSADEIVLEASGGALQKVATGALTINSGTAGAGGLDTGTLAANQWYYGYVIYNGSTVESLMSLSPTTPTLPGGYTYASGAVTAMRTDGSKNFLGFTQKGRNYQWKVGSNLASLPLINSGSAGDPSVPTWVASSIATAVPTAIAATVRLTLSGFITAGCAAAPNNSYGAINSLNPPPLAVGGEFGYASTTSEFVIESTNVYYACGSSPNNSGLWCSGFTINI